MKERFLHSQRLQVCAFPVNLVSINNKGKQKYFVKHGFIPDQLTYSNSESTLHFYKGKQTQEIKGDVSKIM